MGSLNSVLVAVDFSPCSAAALKAARRIADCNRASLQAVHVVDGERIAIEERLDMGRRIRDVIESPDGSILLLVDDRKGGLLRLTPAGGGGER